MQSPSNSGSISMCVVPLHNCWYFVSHHLLHRQGGLWQFEGLFACLLVSSAASHGFGRLLRWVRIAAQNPSPLFSVIQSDFLTSLRCFSLLSLERDLVGVQGKERKGKREQQQKQGSCWEKGLDRKA